MFSCVTPRPNASPKGARRGGTCTLGASFGPGRAPWRVLWALKVARAGKQSRDSIPPRRASQDNGNPTMLYDFGSAAAVSCLCHTVPQALKLSNWWQPRYNGSRTPSSSPFATATGGASVRMSYVVCAFLFPVDVGYRNKHII